MKRPGYGPAMQGRHSGPTRNAECTCFSFVLILLVKILVFGPIFALRPHMGIIVRMDPKPALKSRDVSSVSRCFAIFGLRAGS